MKQKVLFYIFIIVGISLLGIILYLLIQPSKPKEDQTQQKLRQRFSDFFLSEDRPTFLTPEDIEKLIKEKGIDDEVLNQLSRDYSQYPPDSRPLSKEMVDLIDPWKVESQPLPVILNPHFKNETAMNKFIDELKAQGKTEEEIKNIIDSEFQNYPSFVLQTNKHTITFNDTLIATLKITDKKGNVLSYSVKEAGIFGDPHFGSKRIATPEFNDAGISPDKANDNIVTFYWKLPSQDKQYWGNLTLKVKVFVDEINKEVELERGFYSSPTVIAEFVDQFVERIDKGSLVITAYLDVKKECEYHIQANLFNVEEDEPTHWVYFKKILKPGLNEIPFTFYGKIFHDKGLEGHFVLRDLRGYCENLPFPPSWIGDPSKLQQVVNAPPKNEPLFFYIPFTGLTYKTKNYYRLSQFTNKEWSSENP